MKNNEKFKLTEKGKAFAAYCGTRMWQNELSDIFVNDEYEEILADFDFDELPQSEKNQLVAFRYFLFFSGFFEDNDNNSSPRS